MCVSACLPCNSEIIDQNSFKDAVVMCHVGVLCINGSCTDLELGLGQHQYSMYENNAAMVKQ